MLPELYPYSFTSDRRWINHEWLAEVTTALAYDCAGGLGLVVLKVSLLAFAFYFLSRAISSQGAAPVGRYALLAVAAVASIGRIQTMRPQIFSFTATALLLLLLTRSAPVSLLRSVSIAALFAVWANLHGGWIVGLLILALWVASQVLSPGWDVARTARQRRCAPWSDSRDADHAVWSHALGFLVADRWADAARHPGMEFGRILANRVDLVAADDGIGHRRLHPTWMAEAYGPGSSFPFSAPSRLKSLD